MTDTPMTPDVALIRLRQYGDRTSTWSTATYNDGSKKALHQIAVSLGGEVERLRGELSDATGRVDFLERNTLPDLHRQIEHHKDGKARWRKRAETAEARVADLEAFACRCFDPSHHAPDCQRAVVVWNGVKYNAAAWYRDAEGEWWMACAIDDQEQPLMRVRNDPSNEPVPVGEVESDYGPLYRSDDGPDNLQTETF
ncbi:phiSA1p31-related protein [Streptomyces sp. W4I9-2]|uniref:phiSA1p31-related protein n=1 Tax=Streptomyces sp. W4I9-2 TaxID=3042297 RepID=UPI002780BCDB|nr:phiSA1p31-related protein [Streptomyces sp. W4I9-2]MDQ0694232.1 hypothetical protein [Streptomyces sp. W4I9-2]